MIVSCSGAADVIAAVGFARSNDLPIAVRGGGHSDRRLLQLRRRHRDRPVGDALGARRPAARAARTSVRARCGATSITRPRRTRWRRPAVWSRRRAWPGFTLGGGIGWLMRKHGLACDNLVGADVVTADGRLVHASETENADLLWGLRGGGGNFGIVTQFELALHPVGPIVYAGLIFFAAEHDAELLRVFREWAPSVPDDITAAMNLTTAPPLPVVPEEWHGKKVIALIAVSAGPVEEARGAVRVVSRGRRAGRRPARPDAVHGDAVADRPAVAEGHPRVLQGDEPGASGRRADRASVRTAPVGAGAAVRDPRAPDGWRGGPRGRGRHGVLGALDAVRAQRRDRLAGRRRKRPRTRSGRAT